MARKALHNLSSSDKSVYSLKCYYNHIPGILYNILHKLEIHIGRESGNKLMDNMKFFFDVTGV